MTSAIGENDENSIDNQFIGRFSCCSAVLSFSNTVALPCKYLCSLRKRLDNGQDAGEDQKRVNSKKWRLYWLATVM